MRAKHYDVIVLGENTAALVAAALLAARKYRVLIIRRFAGPGRDSYIGHANRRVLPVLPGVFDDPVPAAVIRELNLGHKFRSIFKPASPLFQILDDEHRTTIYEDRVRTAAELQREYGARVVPDDIGTLMGNLEEFDKLYDKLLVPGMAFMPDGIKEKWDTNARIKEHKKNLGEASAHMDELARLWDQSVLGRRMGELAVFAGSVGTGGQADYAKRRAGRLFTELLYPVAGEGIEEVLLEQYDKRGGKVLDQTAFQEVDAGRGGYRFHDARTTYSADAVICGFDYFLLQELFAGKKMERFVAAQLSRVKPEATWIKTSFLVERDVLPEGMGHHWFLRPQNGKPLCFGQRDPLLPADAEVERLDVWTPIAITDYTGAGLSDCQQDIIQRVLWFAPFLEGRLRHVYQEPAPKIEDDGPYLALSGRRLLYGLGDADWFAGVPYTLPLKHAWLAGPEVFPELGLEGEFMAGWAIAGKVMKEKPHKDELK